MPDTPAEIIDPAATDESSENARNGAARRRDPNEPAAVVGLGASAGGIAVLQQFFSDMSPKSGLAFVVVMHLSPEHESNLAGIIQLRTAMPVTQVSEAVKVKPNHVYVIPPNHQLAFEESMLRLVAPQQALGKRVTIDLFFRTLAQAYGQRALCVILSGTDSDGAIGLKHIRAQGGVTIAQDPNEAEHDSMPAMAINTGMVDWVLPVAQMPAKLLEFVNNEQNMQLPPEIPEAAEPDAKDESVPGGETVSDETRAPNDESALNEVLAHLRAATGHDFTHYKRATILRRIARRLQVNSIETIPHYLKFLRKHAAENRALLQDMLIGVTHFFRDQESFAALEANIPQLFAGKHKNDQLRIWVAGCATGEEAYSIAMLLCEYAERLDAPPGVQIFASDIDEQAIQEARDGVYPSTIEADVSQERLRRFFARDHGRYRVRKSLREKVLFAAHNVLHDAPFSRLDLVSCRNLLIYLNPKAQEQVFDIFHFALRSGGLLFIGGSESTTVQGLFAPVDGKHRIYVRRSVPRPSWKVPVLPLRAPQPALRARPIARPRPLPVLAQGTVEEAGTHTQEALFSGQERRAALFGELHLKLLEQYAPPSIVVNEEHEIVHLSEKAGRYLHFAPGEPSMNLFRVIMPELQIELRTALFRASQGDELNIMGAPHTLHFEGRSETIALQVRRIEAAPGEKFYLVLFEKHEAAEGRHHPALPTPAMPSTMARDLDDEIQNLKEQLASNVEQSEASSEELKASNEELQAMNEEMRSATEELETSKEELQSVNEELTTVNNELKSSIEDLSRANTDLSNLMVSADIGTLFLDRQLRVQRFTPAAQKIFNLIPSDLSRPISDITHKLQYDGLTRDAEEVLEHLTPIERELKIADDGWYLMRIAPYRTAEDRIAGVVATFIDITRRKTAEDELRESHRLAEIQAHKFSTIMAGVPDFLYQFDLEGRFSYISQSLLDLWQKTREEAIGKNFHELAYPPELATKLQRQIQEVIETCQTLKDDTPYTSAFGERMYEYIFFPLRGSDGSVEGVGGVTRDITERRLAEEALRESEARFRAMFEQASVGIVQISEDGRFVAANRGFCHFIGYSESELKQMLVREVTDLTDYAEEEELTRRLTSGEIPEYTLDKRYLRKGGAVVWGTMTATFVRRASGEPLYTLAIVQAIGDRKRAEEELRGSEERFRQFAENSTDVFWIVDAEKQVLEYLNPVFDEMFGEPRATLLREIERYYDLIHPDDCELAGTAMRSALAGKRDVVEYRIIRPSDGSVRWIRDTGFPIPDETGRIARVAGVAQDVTEDKNRTEEIRRAEERFRLLVEGTPDYAMFLIDPDNKITYWSSGAEKVFGWSAQEAVGQTGDLIFTPEDRAKGAVEKEISIALDQGHAPDRRWHLRNDGSRLWVDGIMRRLDRADGSLRGFAKIARDATEQWRAEEELRSAHGDLEHRVHARTKELQAMNETLEQEMQRRQTLESEILQVTERERANISQDLHDSLCQELTATAFLLKSRARNLGRTDPEAGEALIESAEMVNRNAGLARDLARGLHPLEMGTGGLISALRELAARTSQTVTCRCECPRSLRVPNEAVAVNLYRIAQEAVKNALKHARPSEVMICIERLGDEIHLVITDNGTPKRQRKGGLGIQMMQYRASVSGGTLEVSAKKGKGTKVNCRVPAKQ